jgi:lipopolysaccharide export system permease protein
MKLFWYCLKEYIKYVCGTLVLTIFLFILFDFIHKSTKYFAEYKPNYNDVFFYYVFQIPNQIVQALPIGGLLGGVISMILLNRTNEITAMRAIGLGPFQLARPLIAGGVLLSCLSLILNESFVPRYAKRVSYIQSVKIEKKNQNMMAGLGRWVRDGNRFIHWNEYDFVNEDLIKVQLVVMDGSFSPAIIYEADRAHYDTGRNDWTMRDVRVDYIKAGKILEKSEVINQFIMKLPLEPHKMLGDSRKPNELSLAELDEVINRGEKSGANIIPYKMDFEGKRAYPFAALVVSLIGLKFAYKSERSADTAKGVLLAFFIGISYWVVLSAGRALGLRGDLSPFLAAWLPNVVVLIVVVLDGWVALAKQNQ